MPRMADSFDMKPFFHSRTDLSSFTEFMNSEENSKVVRAYKRDGTAQGSGEIFLRTLSILYSSSALSSPVVRADILLRKENPSLCTRSHFNCFVGRFHLGLAEVES